MIERAEAVGRLQARPAGSAAGGRAGARLRRRARADAACAARPARARARGAAACSTRRSSRSAGASAACPRSRRSRSRRARAPTPPPPTCSHSWRRSPRPTCPGRSPTSTRSSSTTCASRSGAPARCCASSRPCTRPGSARTCATSSSGSRRSPARSATSTSSCSAGTSWSRRCRPSGPRSSSRCASCCSAAARASSRGSRRGPAQRPLRGGAGGLARARDAPRLRTRPMPTVAIELVAADRIRRVYRRMVRDGSAIDDDSPAEALHDLRKRGKELRYLLELFGGLFEPKVVKPMVEDAQGAPGRARRLPGRRGGERRCCATSRDELAGEPGGPAALIAARPGPRGAGRRPAGRARRTSPTASRPSPRRSSGRSCGTPSRSGTDEGRRHLLDQGRRGEDLGGGQPRDARRA